MACPQEERGGWFAVRAAGSLLCADCADATCGSLIPLVVRSDAHGTVY